MDVNVYNLNEISNELVLEKIKKKESFTLQKIDPMRFHSAVETLERLINRKGLNVEYIHWGELQLQEQQLQAELPGS